MNSSSGCACGALRNCIFVWTVPTGKRREWKNYWSGRRRGARPAADCRERRRSSDMLRDVLRQIEQRERFVLTSHARPDGDAVGSALACCQVLRAMGKQADVVLHDGVP